MLKDLKYHKLNWPFEKPASDVLNELVSDIRLHYSELENAGIYLLTSNSGANSSVDFWKAAMEQGVDFANPRNFPWTLASCPAGNLARQLDITGPNYTLIGNSKSLKEIGELMEFDFETGLIKNALFVALDWSFDESEKSIVIYSVIQSKMLQAFKMDLVQVSNQTINSTAAISNIRHQSVNQ